MNALINNPERYEELDEDVKTQLHDWIIIHMVPGATFNKRHNSYGLKHRFTDATGIYITNGQFKGAMLEAGYIPQDMKALNWHFKIENVGI